MLLGLIERIPARAAVILGLLLLPVVALGNYLTGAEVACNLLYLGPIALVAWRAGRGAGLAVAASSAAVSFWVDLVNHPVYTYDAIRYWNLGIEGVVFLAFALALAGLGQRLHAEAAQARADPLTGLANRRAFDEAANLEMERARRAEQSLTLAYIDVDNFKSVNDRLGHEVGDAVLVAVARALRKGVRAIDIVARLGGDEFAVVFHAANSAAAGALIERLRGNVITAMKSNGWSVTVSMGAATFEVIPETLSEVVREADRVMYEVKATGKNRLLHETHT